MMCMSKAAGWHLMACETVTDGTQAWSVFPGFWWNGIFFAVQRNDSEPEAACVVAHANSGRLPAVTRVVMATSHPPDAN